MCSLASAPMHTSLSSAEDAGLVHGWHSSGIIIVLALDIALADDDDFIIIITDADAPLE